MSYKKTLPETALKTVDVLAAEGSVDVGCYVSEGKLVPAINIVNPLNALSAKPVATWYTPTVKKYIVLVNGRIYYSSGSIDGAMSIPFAAKYPSIMHIRTTLSIAAIIPGDTTYFSVSALGFSNPYNGAARSCVLKNGRIFGVDTSNAYKLKWSGEGGIDDWTEGISGAGWAYVQYGYGEILNLIVYKDKIVVIREYGLSFFSAYGTPENFKLSYLERKLPKICKDTAAIVCDKLIFYTEDGLYGYDGSKVEKLNFKYADDIQSPAYVSCFKDKYYLCGESKLLGRKAVLMYDAIKNVSYFIDAPLDFVTAGERIFGYTSVREFELTEGGMYSFTSGELDFSSDGYKVLKEIKIDGGGEDTMIIVTNGVKARLLRGVRGKIRPHMRGKKFTVVVMGSKEINSLTAVAEVANEV